MNEVIEILRAEQKRIARALPTLEPGTEEYSRVLEQFSTMSWRIGELEGLAVNALTPAPVLTPDPEPAPVTVDEEPTPAPEEPKTGGRAEVKDWEKYRLTLRERLGEARLKGVNTSGLIAAMGVGKFSSVPDEKLPELSDLLDKALKELA